MTRTKQALWSRRFYEKNKSKRLADNKARKVEAREWLQAYKKTHPCIRCGESAECCLDFHHRVPEEKVLEVATTVVHGWSVQHIANEIAKCDVLCSNCHRKLHRGRLV